MDTNDGDEQQDRWCSACHHSETWLRSAGGGYGWNDHGDASGAPRAVTDPVEQTLLAQIAAAPADDGPRLVYADWLLERDDPRGRFIALQCAQRDAVVTADERALLAAHWQAWIGRAAAVLRPGDVEFERGMWSACDWITQAGVALLDDAILEDPAWATVRRIAILPWLMPAQLLVRPHRGALRAVVVESKAALAAVAVLGLAIEEVELTNRDDERPHLPALPTVQRMAIRTPAPQAGNWIDVAAGAGVRDVTVKINGGGIPAVQKILRAVRRAPVTTLTIEVGGTYAVRATRVDGGSLVVRAILLLATHRAWALRDAEAHANLALLDAAPDAVVESAPVGRGLRPYL